MLYIFKKLLKSFVPNTNKMKAEPSGTTFKGELRKGSYQILSLPAVHTVHYYISRSSWNFYQ